MLKKLPWLSVPEKHHLYKEKGMTGRKIFGNIILASVLLRLLAVLLCLSVVLQDTGGTESEPAQVHSQEPTRSRFSFPLAEKETDYADIHIYKYLIVKKNNGLWCTEAEQYLLTHAPRI